MATTAQFKATFDKNHLNVLDDPNLLLVGVVANVAEIRQYFAGRTLTKMERTLIWLLLERVTGMLADDSAEPPGAATSNVDANVSANSRHSGSQPLVDPSNTQGNVSATQRKKATKRERARRHMKRELEEEREAAKQAFERTEAERVARMEHIDVIAERVWKFCARYPAVLTQSQLKSFQNLKRTTAHLVSEAKKASAAEKDAVQKAAAAAKAAAAKADVEKIAIEQASKGAKKGDEAKKIDESEGSKNAVSNLKAPQSPKTELSGLSKEQRCSLWKSIGC